MGRDSGLFGYMQVYCPICRQEMDGMKGYGRQANCCGRDCYTEWEVRKSFAILKKPYPPFSSRLDDAGDSQALKSEDA